MRPVISLLLLCVWKVLELILNSTLERQSHQLEQAAMIRDGIELVLLGPKLFWLVTVLSSKQQVLFDTKNIASYR